MSTSYPDNVLISQAIISSHSNGAKYLEYKLNKPLHNHKLFPNYFHVFLNLKEHYVGRWIVTVEGRSQFLCCPLECRALMFGECCLDGHRGATERRSWTVRDPPDTTQLQLHHWGWQMWEFTQRYFWSLIAKIFTILTVNNIGSSLHDPWDSLVKWMIAVITNLSD